MWQPGQILSSAFSTMPFMPVHHFISRMLKSDECSGSILLSPSAYPLSLIVRELFWAAALFSMPLISTTIIYFPSFCLL